MTYLLSALSIFVLWGVGNKWKWIWAVGILSQIIWFIFIYQTKLYGLIPMHVVYLCLYTINLIKWTKEG
jgi:hypothetical protein